MSRLPSAVTAWEMDRLQGAQGIRSPRGGSRPGEGSKSVPFLVLKTSRLRNANELAKAEEKLIDPPVGPGRARPDQPERRPRRSLGRQFGLVVEAVLGLIHLRGLVVTTVRPRQRFELPATHPRADQRTARGMAYRPHVSRNAAAVRPDQDRPPTCRLTHSSKSSLPPSPTAFA